MKYYSNEPNMGIEWRTGATFQFRVLGDFTKLINKGVTENILSANTSWLKVKDYTIQARMLDLYEQVPSWYAEKINLILSNDVVTIDDLEVVGSERVQFEYTNQALSYVKPSWIVDIKDNLSISKFREKPVLDHWIHAGIDLFKKDVLERFPLQGQMEETIFVDLEEEQQLKAFMVDPKYYWRSIDSPKDLQEANREWKGIELE